MVKGSIGKAKAAAAMQRRLDRAAAKAARKDARRLAARQGWFTPRWFGVSEDYPYYE